MAADSICARGVAALKPDVVSLCNNHIMDYGEDGLRSTIAALKEAGIAYFGAGDDLDEADRPHYFVKNGVQIGVYAVCEHEFSVATERTAGANPLNLIELGDRIRDIRSNCDRLIVLYHGGREHYPYPSPNVQSACRKMAECGASLVLCQHSHCVGCYEKWENATIVYGQGNFIFDVTDGEACFDTGLLVRYSIGNFGADKVSFVPIVRTKGGAELADDAKAAEIMEAFETRSRRIRVQGFVKARYKAYAEEKKDVLLKAFIGDSVALRGLNVIHGRKTTKMFSRESKLKMLDYLMCESIHELLTEGLYNDVF
jgi:poly-gamma-glutamate synthesis protein (capsule biosynthesis protein)